MGFIYWMEHAPNPWVRGIAIVVTGAFAYFYRDQPGVPPESEWLGMYGQCGSDQDDPYEHWY